MTRKQLVGALAILTVVIGAYWYWSPVLALQRMHSAAAARDAARFNSFVDYPKVRESLKSTIADAVSTLASEASAGGGELEALGAAMGSTLMIALATPFVEEIVRPEVVAGWMADGTLQIDYAKLRQDLKAQFASAVSEARKPDGGSEWGALFGQVLGSRLFAAVFGELVDEAIQPEVFARVLKEGGLPTAGADSGRASPSSSDSGRFDASATRIDLNTYSVTTYNEWGGTRGHGTLVFERQGFADWKLSMVLIELVR